MMKLINLLKSKLDKDIWSDNKKDFDKYLVEPRGRFKGKTNLLLRPRTTKEVSTIVKICNKYNLPLVPQGGRTGLAGGIVPSKKGDELVLSLERMNKILTIEASNYLMTVQAGCVLSKIKKASEKKKLLFSSKTCIRRKLYYRRQYLN